MGEYSNKDIGGVNVDKLKETISRRIFVSGCEIFQFSRNIRSHLLGSIYK
jgi:hypothetical protein